MVRPPNDSSTGGGSSLGERWKQRSAEDVEKKLRDLMRKWVDWCRKSGTVPNPPRTAAVFFESLVPSRGELSDAQAPR